MAGRARNAILRLKPKNIRSAMADFWHSQMVAGFAMVEIILAIGVSALVAQFLLSGILLFKKFREENVTEARSEMIFKSLAGYVLRNGCLPYPSMPSRRGEEFPHPKSESGWNSQELMRGIVPYSTLGMDEKYAKDGRGYYFTYVVNPGLCARKNVRMVPPNDAREYLDYGNKKEVNVSVTKSKQFFAELTVEGECAVKSKHHIVCDPKEDYSSYRAVRSYSEDYYHEGDPLNNGQTKTWDIATRKAQSQIKCFDKAEIQCEQFYYLKPNRLRSQNPDKTTYENFVLEGVVQAVRVNDDAVNDKYKVSDCVAVVLISHSGGGSFGENDSVVKVKSEASGEKLSNSNSLPMKNHCYLRAKGDKVYWQSRFGLLANYTNLHCAPAQIMLY